MQNNILNANTEVDERFAQTTEIRERSAALKERIALFKKEIEKFDENTNTAVRETQRKIKDNADDLQKLDEKLKNFTTILNEQYEKIENYNLGCI